MSGVIRFFIAVVIFGPYLDSLLNNPSEYCKYWNVLLYFIRHRNLIWDCYWMRMPLDIFIFRIPLFFTKSWLFLAVTEHQSVNTRKSAFWKKKMAFTYRNVIVFDHLEQCFSNGFPCMFFTQGFGRGASWVLQNFPHLCLKREI